MKIILLILLLIPNIIFGQCAGNQSFTLNPLPISNQYTPGQVVTVCYTMQSWGGTTVSNNWLEGFDINLGPGWTGLIQSTPPAVCSNGQWLWQNSVTSSATGITVGPGWFFEIQGITDGNPGNDYGDFGTTCTWSFCFQVTVVQSCNPQNLLIAVTAGADGTWGSWGSNACPTVPFNIFNGTINPVTPSVGLINHN